MYFCTILLVAFALQQASALPTASAQDDDGDGYKDRGLKIAEINKDLNLHEGDIMTGRDRNIQLADEFKWDIPVPYVLDDSLDLNAKGVVLRAFDHIRLKSCVDFKPWESEPNYIKVIKAEGCWSYVGNQHTGNQSLSIGQWCDHHGIVVHEILHALGFWHEQSRYDRDDYVTIIWENIEEGMEHNFLKHSSDQTTTLGTMYDYMSVMHYSKDAFSNGNGSTIITNLPEYQDKIGQNLEMSFNDVVKLRKLYKCTSAAAFLESCSFEDETVCGMSLCAFGNIRWERVNSTKTGPVSDHTSLSSQRSRTGPENQTDSALRNDTTENKDAAFFMHCSTVSGKEGDGAKMQSGQMKPKRQFQCLQFFYFHSGGDKDQLNIWIRENDETVNGAAYLLGQITGPPTFHWQIHHVPLNATKPFQVEFEVHKGAGNSSGGFSLDDINLFEIDCPHHVWRVPGFDHFLTNGSVGSSILSPRFITREGYGLQLLVYLYSNHFGVFFRLVSTDQDEQLQWPCVWKQVTVSLLDQSHQIQQRMSRQISITTNSEKTFTGDNGETFQYWDNPRKVGRLINDTDGGQYYAGPGWGYKTFLSLDEVWSGNFIKEGTVFFLLHFDDLSHLHVNHTDLPKPQMWSDLGHVNLMHTEDRGPCVDQWTEHSTTHTTPFQASLAVSPSSGSTVSMLAVSVTVVAGHFLLMC